MFSLYFAFSKDFGPIGKFTLGLGRGEFIGYDRGKYLSTAAFFDQVQLTSGSFVNEIMFGLFAGVEIPIATNFAFLAEVDGRDVNAGIRYFTDFLSVDLALTHAELFTSNQTEQRPRVDMSVNYLFDFGKKKVEYGYLAINVIDNSTNKYIPATISFEGLKVKPLYLKNGKVKMKMKPGKYTVKIEAEDYKWQKRILTIASNATNEINVSSRHHAQPLHSGRLSPGRRQEGCGAVAGGSKAGRRPALSPESSSLALSFVRQPDILPLP